jgi:hypothetical protein
MLHRYDTNPYMEDMTATKWSNTTDLFLEMEASLYFLSSEDVSNSEKSWTSPSMILHVWTGTLIKSPLTITCYSHIQEEICM